MSSKSNTILLRQSSHHAEFKAKKEEQLKKAIDAINTNNEDPESVEKMGLNDMADMPNEEFRAERTGAKSIPPQVRAKGGFLPPESVRNDPVNRAIMAAFHKKLEAKYPAEKIPKE